MLLHRSVYNAVLDAGFKPVYYPWSRAVCMNNLWEQLRGGEYIAAQEARYDFSIDMNPPGLSGVVALMPLEQPSKPAGFVEFTQRIYTGRDERFTMFMLGDDPDLETAEFQNPNAVFIERIGVLPLYRGRQLGQLLLCCVIDLARFHSDCSFLALEALEGVENYYLKMGMWRISTRYRFFMLPRIDFSFSSVVQFYRQHGISSLCQDVIDISDRLERLV
ncbi:GNAT family N-acetyltransferase [Spongorhabdus nitratireducens]